MWSSTLTCQHIIINKDKSGQTCLILGIIRPFIAMNANTDFVFTMLIVIKGNECLEIKHCAIRLV